ncbi:MAG: recombinase family protein [Eubacterium sp.]
MTRQTAIYARQSVDKKESLSIEGQIELCQGIDKNAVIYRDKGYSGKNTERPELQRLLEDIVADKIKKVVVYKLDRISRNITDFYKLYEIMNEHKCEFVSVSEAFDTSNAMGRAMMGILAVFAQMERENIQKRVKDNYYYRTAQTGSWAGGPAPYGFKNGRNEQGKPTLIPIEKEIEAVMSAFALYYGVDTCTLGEVARWLNENGYKPHKRDVFDSVTVSKILQNPIYVIADKTLYAYFKTRKINFLNDEEQWDGTRSAHVIGKKVGNSNIRKYTTMKEQSIYLTNFEGFIQSVIYINVQKRLAMNEQFARANAGGILEELSGKLKCGCCGYAIKSYSKSTNGRPYLDCYGNRTLHICEAKYNKINFYDLQKIIGDEIQKQLDDMENLRHKKEVENAEIEKQIGEIQADIDKLIELSLHSDLTAEALASAIEKKQTELNQLELKHQMNKTAASMTTVYFSNNVNIADEFSHHIVYEDLRPDQKKEVVKLLIDKIFLTSDINNFEIVWNI